MNTNGLTLCSRFAFPPNFLSLCGPQKQNDLSWYATQGKADAGVKNILSQFTTMFPYLQLIAGENHIKDPFDPRVVNAYWIGNGLLQNISYTTFARHLEEGIDLKRKLKRKNLAGILGKLPTGALPTHSFHVLNVWRRTGFDDSPHTIATMEACLINIGKVVKILPNSLLVESVQLTNVDGIIMFGSTRARTIETAGKKDMFLHKVHVGDNICYHWGKFVKKLTRFESQLLIYYTRKALALVNKNSYENNFYFG